MEKHNKDKNNNPKPEKQEKKQEVELEEVENAAPIEEDDDVATQEDIEAYAREAALRRANKEGKRKVEEEVDHAPEEEYIDAANAVNPYLEPDPTMPFVPYTMSPFVTRGCNHCPESYVPVKGTETMSCGKLTATNWMKGIRQPATQPFDCVEVRLKNNRKDFYRLPDGLTVEEGDVVAVEGQPGHDVGLVTMTGELCRLQMKKKRIDPESEGIRKLFRRAKSTDIEKWAQTIAEENTALLLTRKISEDLGLQMKVNDVEFQADRTKAIFYYTADERVDFRSLIKVLAEQFRVRVEMKQIGVRQEAGKVGGIGTCGRELCCCTWLSNFKSVTTGVAKAQQILPNPQKLAGQCGKLKCCLNFEYEVYADALKNFPPGHTPIRFQKGLALYKKTDVLRGIMWYAYEGENDLYAIPAESVKQIIEMNRNQQYPEKLEDFQVELMSTSALVQESNEAEFEQELRRMADSGNGVVEEKNENRREGSREGREGGNREGRDNRNRNRDRDRRDGRDRDRKEHRDGEKREGREGHESREGREGRENRGEGRNENRGENRENRGEGRENRDRRDRDRRDHRDHRDRDRNNREGKENKERKENKDNSEKK